MSTQRNQATLIHHEEAGALTKGIADERLRAFINYGLTTALIRRGMAPDIELQSDFDLRFFAEVLRAMGENPAALLRILQGDISDMEWWLEET